MTTGEDDPSVDHLRRWKAGLRQLDAGDGQARREAAKTIYGLAKANPDAATAFTDAVSYHLTADDPIVRRYVASSLAATATVDASSVVESVPTLVDLLDDESTLVKRSALDCLRRIAEADANAIVSAIPPAVELTRHDDRTFVRANAVKVLLPLSRHVPTAFDGHITPLVETLDEPYRRDKPAPPHPRDAARNPVRDAVQTDRANHETVREGATIVVSRVAGVLPDRVANHAGVLEGHCEDPNVLVRKSALTALTQIIEARPSSGAHAAETLGDCLSDGEKAVSAQAARALTVLLDEGEHHAVDHVDVAAVLDLLDSDDPDCRLAGSSLATYVAELAPAELKPHAALLEPILDDPSALVRGQAVWALGFLEGDDSRSTFETVEREDPDEDVREIASHVRENLVGGTPGSLADE